MKQRVLKRILTAVLSASMVLGLGGMTALAAEPDDSAAAIDDEDPLSMADATVTDLTVTVDGEEMDVTEYEDVYVANPNSDEQMISIYVPEGATESSAIMFYVNNSGWQSDTYSGRVTVTDGKEYSGTSDTDKVGKALSENYVIVSYGCRSRADGANADGEYLGHSPATVTDTKAAIRYLRYNKDILPAGNTERIVISGGSGGGGLSSVIAASGNSSDYFDTLYDLGAAGIEQDADGNYTSIDGIGDDVFAVIAYCPVNDFRAGDAAYEWTFGDARTIVNGHSWTAWNDREDKYTTSSYNYTETQLEDSATLKAAYPEYLDSLGLTYNGEPVTSDNIDSAISDMMVDEINQTMEETGETIADLIDEVYWPDTDLDNPEDTVWLVDNGDGTYTYDYFKHRTWLCVSTFLSLKNPCAFSNQGYTNSQSEDNLFGTIHDVYSPFEFLSWQKDTIENNVGYDDTGLTWDEYMETDAGKYLSKQIRMTTSVDYLADLLQDDGGDDAADDGTPASYWYVRHGMVDRDISFTSEGVLFLAIQNNVENGNIKGANTGYAWLQTHGGDYDVQEAYAWLEDALEEADAADTEPGPVEEDPLSMADAVVTEMTVTVDDQEMGVTEYEDVYVGNQVSDEQRISIYVPEGATEDSAVMFFVYNRAWEFDSYAEREQISDGDVYTSTSDEDKIGKCLSENYVIVSYGCRGRSDDVVDDQYVNHAPATVADSKAAIRYLRYNADLLPAGNLDRIVVTGGSGGGGLTSILSATGNSSDYFEALYEIGAAGIVQNADGSYSSEDGLGDDVFACIAYCPVNDFSAGDAAYEWTFGDARKLINGTTTLCWNDRSDTYSDYTYEYTDEQLAASDELAASYPAYLDSLNLTYNGEPLSADNINDAITDMMEEEIDKTLEEKNCSIQDLIDEVYWPTETTLPEGSLDWLVDNGDGTYTYDYSKHTTWMAVATWLHLKDPSAFSNYGLLDDRSDPANEDNLFGSINDEYCPFNFYSWNNDAITNNVGLDDTGLTWDEFMDTEAGQEIAMQIRMSTSAEYLSDLLVDEGGDDTADDGTPADYWYVRHGMMDRDISYTSEGVLFLAIENNVEAGNIKGADVGYAWLQHHGGDYDVQEAYAWLEDVLEEADSADKSALEELIDLAESYNESDYTPETWEALQSALADAQAVMDDPDATQDEVDAAAAALQDALDNMETTTPINGLYRIVSGQLWGYFVDGKVDTSYTGFASNENGDWYVLNGYINFGKSSVYKDKTGVLDTPGTWYYVVNNKVQHNFTGLAHYSNENGWWYIKNGEVDFSHNGVDKNQNGWWYVTGGKVQFGFSGLAHYKNQYGWWYITNGKVNFNANTVAKNQNGWWYVTGGKVQFGFTGLAHYRNSYGWWYIKNGKVDFTYNGSAKNQNGTWNVVNGKVVF